MLPLVIQIERMDERVADTCAFAKSPVRVGRNPLSDLQLDESFVSQWHGVIRFDETRTTYLDLGSTNPTLVDGQAVRRNVEVEVTETTDIRIGSLRLHLLRVSAPPELFGARRKSSFAQLGGQAFNSAEATMFLGPRSPELPRSPLAGLPYAPTAVQPPKAAPSQSSTPQPSAAPARGIDASYRDFARSRSQFLADARVELEQATPSERTAALERLVQRYPELANEPELRGLLPELGLESWRTGTPDVSDWLRRLTGGLVPLPGVTPNNALSLERIGEVLEVFSSAFIELRTSHEQFCDEMSLDKPLEESMLSTTKNPRAVLAYLLNPDVGPNSKVTDLARALADFAVHQVALVSAVVEGARDVLQGLAPNALTGRGEKPGVSFFGKLMGADQKELWARYVAAFDEILDQDHFTRKLFGRDFARKYYAITGGRRSLPPVGQGHRP